MFSVVTPVEEGDATGVQWAEAGDVAKHLIMYRTASHKRIILAPNLTSVLEEKMEAVHSFSPWDHITLSSVKDCLLD